MGTAGAAADDEHLLDLTVPPGRRAPPMSRLAQMRRPKTISVLPLVLAFASLLAATPTAAAPGAEEEAAPLGFTLKGTHGYLISVSPSLSISGREGIDITVSRGNEAASYTAPAEVTPESIRAGLGRLGRIDLVFHSSGQKKKADVGCLSHSETYEAGTYDGVFEFDGERGFTRARATSVAARPALESLARRFCRQHSSGESRGPNLPGARLAGVSFAHGRTLMFRVNKNRPTGRTVFSASLAERRDGIRIFRESSGVAPARAFRWGKHLRTATLSPPRPFAGSATVRRTRDAVSPHFSGDLTFSFPGHTVRMAGPEVHVNLVHARLTRGNDPSSISFRR